MHLYLFVSMFYLSHIEVDGMLLDVEVSFCYLGVMLYAGQGCALAIATRCSTAWGKFRKLLPILTSKHVSPLTRGKEFSACVRSALLHGSELGHQQPKIYRGFIEMIGAMIRWICSVKPHD